MIRREVPATGAAPPQWILIPQIEHARAAAALAEHWGRGDFGPLLPRSELLWAIAHHDDGWRAWDEAPQVDPVRGQPRSFTEMDPVDSLAIWSASIEMARRAGPLEAYLVAGHFCALARRVSPWINDPLGKQHVQQFLAEHETRMASWLADWKAQNPDDNSSQRAALALGYLQFFDALSLWFCCAPASEPEQVETPGGPVLTLDPLGRERVVLRPWPLGVASLNLEVQCRVLAAGQYATAGELAAAPSQPLRLHWHLQGPGEKVDAKV
jgi:hypothetical protein